MRIEILDDANEDLIDGFHFYEEQSLGLGSYFLDSLFSDIDSLLLYAGIHRVVYDSYRCVAYGAYPSFAKGSSITLAGCWAHARRKFYEAKEQAPRQAGFILRQIGQLYKIEARLKNAKAGPRLREAVRSSQSMTIYRRIERTLALLKKSGRYLPRSSMGKAIDYALGNFPLLGVYLGDGRVEIDNNLVENSIRPTAIGKKNWLFFGDAEAGQRSAILYTIIESCRRRGINPYEYLRDVLTRLPHATNWNVGELTPENWEKARKGEKVALLAA